MKQIRFNRKNLLQAIYLACVAAFMMSRAQADIVASDDFGGYTPGTTQSSTSTGTSNFTNEGFGFSNAWTTTSGYPGNNTYTIVSGPLSSPTGTLATSGNTLVGTSSGSYNNTIFSRNLNTAQGFGLTPGNTLFASILLQPTGTLGAGAYGGYFQFSLGNGQYQTYFGGQSAGNSAMWQLAATLFGTNETGSPAKSTTLESSGTTVQLVEEISFVDANTTTFSLFIDPTPGGSLPATPDVQITQIANPIFAYDITSVSFQNSGNFAASDLILGTTWADVTAAVPEPSEYALMFLGGAALLGVALRRKKVTA